MMRSMKDLGGVWGCHYFPFIEEKIEACKCLMWVLMCRAGARLSHGSTDGWMFGVPLLVGLSGLASARIPVQITKDEPDFTVS